MLDDRLNKNLGVRFKNEYFGFILVSYRKIFYFNQFSDKD